MTSIEQGALGVHSPAEMSYEAWRITFQSSEQAARAAYEAWRITHMLALDDVVAGHPLAIEELAALRLSAERWEKARRMNPRQWADAWEQNITTGTPFDEIIDSKRIGWVEERNPAY